MLPHDSTACVNSASITLLHSYCAATLAVRECLHDVVNGMSHGGCMMQHDACSQSEVWQCSQQSTRVNAVAGAFLFEDVGVTAFAGAIPQVSQKPSLELLAGIAPVEAYHAAILRTLLYQKGFDMVQPYNIRVFDFVQVTCVSISH